MTNNLNFQELLGLKQEDIAFILQVTRSQWSMYVLGKRDLPILAKIKLAEMIAFVNQTSVLDNEISEMSTNEVTKRNEFYTLQIKTNEFNKIIIEQKLKRIEKKYNSALTLLKLVDFFEKNPEKLDPINDSFLKILLHKATTEIEKNNLLVQEQLKIKLEVLQFEASLLQKKKNGY